MIKGSWNFRGRFKALIAFESSEFTFKPVEIFLRMINEDLEAFDQLLNSSKLAKASQLVTSIKDC